MFSLGDIVREARDSGGALDEEQIFIQYICNTGEETVAHDPETPPDSRVRPAHAALHGRVFRLDESAPIPPLDYGCRCGIRYVAKPGTPAEGLIGDKAETEPVTVAEAYRDFLDTNAPKWEEIVDAAEGQRFPMLAAEAKARELGYAKDIARMALTIRPVKPMLPRGRL